MLYLAWANTTLRILVLLWPYELIQSRMIINIRLAAHEIHRIILKMRSSLSAVCLNFFTRKINTKWCFGLPSLPPYFIAQYLNVYSTWKWQKYFIWRQVNILYWFIRCLNRNLSMKTKCCKYYCATLTLPLRHIWFSLSHFKNFPNYFKILGSHKNARHSANIGYSSV